MISAAAQNGCFAGGLGSVAREPHVQHGRRQTEHPERRRDAWSPPRIYMSVRGFALRRPAQAPRPPRTQEMFVESAGRSLACRSASSSNHIAFRIANAHARPSPRIQVKYHTACPQ